MKGISVYRPACRTPPSALREPHYKHFVIEKYRDLYELRERGKGPSLVARHVHPQRVLRCKGAQRGAERGSIHANCSFWPPGRGRGFVGAPPRGAPARRAPHFFSKKKWGKENLGTDGGKGGL